MERDQIQRLLGLPLKELMALADRVRKEAAGKKVELCSIMNAKSGLCPEDCKFCAQASRHATGITTYPLKSKKEILEAALRAREIGAERFDIVTSGDRLSQEELKVISEAIFEITTRLKIKMCASLGTLRQEDFLLLKQAGLSRYHHNLETSPRFFPHIVSTHTFGARVETIRAAKQAGLEVCSGGIIGMGETMDDRIELALWLKELNVDAVPINVLVPIRGTPLEARAPVSVKEVLTTVALLRIILKDKIIKIAAGRESFLGNAQLSAFKAGANGMLIGGYLTIKGQALERDRELITAIKKTWSNN
jgi:biotin synthase